MKIDEYLWFRVLETIHSLFSRCDLYYRATENATLIQPYFKLSLITHSKERERERCGGFSIVMQVREGFYFCLQQGLNAYFFIIHNKSYFVPLVRWSTSDNDNSSNNNIPWLFIIVTLNSNGTFFWQKVVFFF